MKKFLVFLFLFLSIYFGYRLRIFNLNWDNGTQIHPDERFLSMVLNDIAVPTTFSEYLNPQKSSMNPFLRGHSFYVYGTFPVYLTKIVSQLYNYDRYGEGIMVGRQLSAAADSAIILLLFLITITLFPSLKNSFVSLLPGFFYSFLPLPIQLSHFFATDTFLAFFMASSFFLHLLAGQLIANKAKLGLIVLIFAAINNGLGLACKVTFLASFLLNLLVLIIPSLFNKKKNVFSFLFSLLINFIFSYLFFRVCQPMAFADVNFFNFHLNPQWLKNLTELKSMNSPSLENTFPPAIQWFHTVPFVYPLKNLLFWGTGLPLGVFTICSLFWFMLKFTKEFFMKNKSILINFLSVIFDPSFLLAAFSVCFFLFQGIQFSKAMRYFYPEYWPLMIFSGVFFGKILGACQKKISPAGSFSIFFFIVLTFLLFPLSFMRIYARPHSRVTASRWMYENLPAGSKITFEEWDDPLPLMVDGKQSSFQGIALPMFWPDSKDKWQQLSQKIAEADYIILSSNRVYGSIPRRKDIYPQTLKFYQLLFSGAIGFEKIAEFSSRPTVPFTNIEFIDDKADESWTVYDHPKVTIFKKSEKFLPEKLILFL